MTVRVFGRFGCARTRWVVARLLKWKEKIGENDRFKLVFYDLETAEGMAEAAFQQLEGDLPVVMVDTGPPGSVISGEGLFRDRYLFREESPYKGLSPSLN